MAALYVVFGINVKMDARARLRMPNRNKIERDFLCEFLILFLLLIFSSLIKLPHYSLLNLIEYHQTNLYLSLLLLI